MCVCVCVRVCMLSSNVEDKEYTVKTNVERFESVWVYAGWLKFSIVFIVVVIIIVISDVTRTCLNALRHALNTSDQDSSAVLDGLRLNTA